VRELEVHFGDEATFFTKSGIHVHETRGIVLHFEMDISRSRNFRNLKGTNSS